MTENRVKARRRTLKVGKIVFNERQSVIDCTIRNLSDAGACLELPAGVGFPTSFHFTVGVEGPVRPCKVRWRSRNRVGVTFGHNP